VKRTFAYVSWTAPRVVKENRKVWEELIAYFPWCDTGHIQNDAFNNSYIVPCVFVTAVTFVPSRYLATIGRIMPSRCLATIRGFLECRCLPTIRTFTYPLPSKDRGIHTHTHTQTPTWSHKPTLFFQNEESRLKIWSCVSRDSEPKITVLARSSSNLPHPTFAYDLRVHTDL
jgi:hypothetical protein